MAWRDGGEDDDDDGWMEEEEDKEDSPKPDKIPSVDDVDAEEEEDDDVRLLSPKIKETMAKSTRPLSSGRMLLQARRKVSSIGRSPRITCAPTCMYVCMCVGHDVRK